MSADDTSGTLAPQSALARWRWPLMIGGPVILIAIVAWFALNSGKSQTTDDAYVDIGKAPISAAIAGRVVEVDVVDNQAVKAGQVLFRLDPADEVAALHKAQADLAAAKLEFVARQHAVDEARLRVAAAAVTAAHDGREADRQDALVAAGVASRRDAANARQSANLATADLALAREALATAIANLGGPKMTEAGYPAVAQAQAALETAQIALGRTEVAAPRDGVVARVDELQPGAYVNPSQTVFFLLAGAPWIDANFKENQLARMRIGQPAKIHMDALGGRTFSGHVESFSPGSGSTFSALPAQNATGNWVKVVQRLPVRIAFDKPPPGIAARAGLSATVTVDVTAAGQKPPGS